MDRFDDKWRRRQERWARRQGRWARRHSPQHAVFVGAIIIAIGTIWLLDNLHIVHGQDIWEYWPVFLIVAGLSRVINSHSSGGFVWGAGVAGVGTLILLNNLDLFRFDWDRYWPVLLIGWGVLILVRPWHWQKPWQGPPPGVSATGVSNPTVSMFTIFGSHRRQVDSQDFRGGDLTALFGGIELDLRKAAITGEYAVIDANGIFGGVEIRVPETWNVEAKGAGVFGGFTDETRPPALDPAVKPQRLIVTGAGVFGGVGIKN
jgi:predicted membrane protein